MTQTSNLLFMAALAAAVGFSHTAEAGPCTGASAAKGQQRIDQQRYAEAVAVFTCLVDANPSSHEGYRGRAEAELLRGNYSHAMRDYARITALVLPADPNATAKILGEYNDRLARQPNNIPALTGATFVHWWNFDYAATLPWLERILAQKPDDVFGVLYRGSNRLFTGDAGGVADFERALQLAPTNAHAHFIVADGFTYAYPDPQRAQTEATYALTHGLDTPRVHAILAASAFALGDPATGAQHVQQHIDLVTTEVISAPPLATGQEQALDFVAGRTYEIPIVLAAGQSLSIRTDSPSGAIWDSILVLEGPDGTPVIGNDDFIYYFAGFDWVATQSGTFTLRVTTFEGVSAGDLVITSL